MLKRENGESGCADSAFLAEGVATGRMLNNDNNDEDEKNEKQDEKEEDEETGEQREKVSSRVRN